MNECKRRSCFVYDHANVHVHEWQYTHAYNQIQWCIGVGWLFSCREEWVEGLRVLNFNQIECGKFKIYNFIKFIFSK